MGGGIDSRYQGGVGEKHNSKTKFYVELPIPNELSDSQSVSWDASTMNAFEMAGLRCIVNTEFGQNPSVSLKNAASSLVSGS